MCVCLSTRPNPVWVSFLTRVPFLGQPLPRDKLGLGFEIDIVACGLAKEDKTNFNDALLLFASLRELFTGAFRMFFTHAPAVFI